MAFFRVEHDQMQHPVFGLDGKALTRWEAWSWLLDHAAYKAHEITIRGCKVPVRPAEIPTSLGMLAVAWGWSRSAVQRFLAGLETATFITQRIDFKQDTPPGTPPDTPRDAKLRVITICNYVQNQSSEDPVLALPDTPPDTPPGTPDEIAPYYVSLKKEEDRKGDKKKHRPTDDARATQPDLLGNGQVVALRTTDDVQQAIAAYNLMAGRVGLPVAVHTSPERRRRVRLALTMLGGLDGWAIAMQKITESEFITSGGWKHFKIDAVLTRDKLESLMADAYRTRWKADNAESSLQREVREYREAHPEDSFFHQIGPTGTYKP